MDFLLPVCIGDDWVGVVYRDKEATLCLMDAHDITNKALLCDPSFDVDSLKWFKSDYAKLRILPDQHCVTTNVSSTQHRVTNDEDEKSVMEPVVTSSVEPVVTDSVDSPVPSYSQTPSLDLSVLASSIQTVHPQPQYFVAVPVLVNFDSSNSVENQLAFSQQQIDHHMQSAQYFQQFLPSDSQTVFINDTPSAFMNETCSETPSFDPQ